MTDAKEENKEGEKSEIYQRSTYPKVLKFLDT